MKALPDPDFKYFSNSNALYVFLKAKYISSFNGLLSLVARTWPFLCLKILSFKLSVQPI